MDVAGPAVPELVAVVLLAEDGIGPLPQPGQLRGVGVAVQAEPVGGGRAAGRGGVQRVADGAREFFEPGRQAKVAAEPGLVEPGVDQADLAAQGGDLYGQGG